MAKPVIKNKNASCLIEAKDICPTNVFGTKDGKVFVENANECIGCKACEAHCDGVRVKE